MEVYKPSFTGGVKTVLAKVAKSNGAYEFKEDKVLTDELTKLLNAVKPKLPPDINVANLTLTADKMLELTENFYTIQKNGAKVLITLNPHHMLQGRESEAVLYTALMEGFSNIKDEFIRTAVAQACAQEVYGKPASYKDNTLYNTNVVEMEILEFMNAILKNPKNK